MLSIPVTDFELSVRSRNCLQKMGIRTLGDLTRTTEGSCWRARTSAKRRWSKSARCCTRKGWNSGMFADKSARAGSRRWTCRDLSPDEQAVLERPIADLNLSVRARKCMVRLGLTTIGELVRKTGDDLLECKNFGVTSLNEVREKLTQLSTETPRRLIGRCPPRGCFESFDCATSTRAVRCPARACCSHAARCRRRCPAFMPVGTAATVKGLTIDMLRATGAEMMLGNTYHLALRPGRDVVRDWVGCTGSWAGTVRS